MKSSFAPTGGNKLTSYTARRLGGRGRKKGNGSDSRRFHLTRRKGSEARGGDKKERTGLNRKEEERVKKASRLGGATRVYPPPGAQAKARKGGKMGSLRKRKKEL